MVGTIKGMRDITPADKSYAIQAIMNYKRQNPVKFELKKEALFAKYGLNPQEVVEVADEADKILEKAKKELK